MMAGIILIIPLMTFGNEIDDSLIEKKSQEIMAGALNVAHGDTSLAFHVLATKTGELLILTNRLQADEEVCSKEVERLRSIVGEEEDGFFENLFDSDIVKVVIFGTGVYVGYELAN